DSLKNSISEAMKPVPCIGLHEFSYFAAEAFLGRMLAAPRIAANWVREWTRALERFLTGVPAYDSLARRRDTQGRVIAWAGNRFAAGVVAEYSAGRELVPGAVAESGIGIVSCYESDRK